MSEVYINGEKHIVHFGEHHEASEFIKHPENHHVAGGYLEEAVKHGETRFFTGGKEYKIEHKKGEDGGKGEFFIHTYHH